MLAGEPRSFVDLHCHTNASFDSLAAPEAVVRAAVARGLTHLAITDHDRIEGALRARDVAPAGLTVLVGEEIRTADGDLIAIFIERAVPPGMPAVDTIAAVREQGGLVGIPHPFDRFRGSLGGGTDTASAGGIVAAAGLVDWIETWNARALGRANEHAAAFALDHGLPGVAVSDSHVPLEVAVAYTSLPGDPSDPDRLLAALPGAELVTGRASYVVRLLGPFAKAVQRARGNARVRSAPDDEVAPEQAAERSGR